MLQFYPPKTKFKNKCGFQYAPMHMIFDLKQQDLRNKYGLVVGRHVVDYKDYTTYPSTTKYLSVILILLIAVNNGFRLMAGDIVNKFCTSPCAKNI